MRAVIAAVAFVAASTVGAQAPSPTPEATLDRAVAAYAKVKTVRATFTRSLTNPLMGSAMTSAGEAVQRRPGLLAVRFTDPAGDRIVADGRFLWLYTPSSAPGQVIRMALGANGAGVPDVTAQFLEAPRAKYTVSDAGRATIAGRPARALRLVARDSTLPFTRATVWVDDEDALVRQFETTDASGVVQRVTITRLTVNGAVEASAFTFVPPQGVRVYNQGGGR